MQPVDTFENVKTDQEIYQSALEEWLGVLAQLWMAYDKPIDPERLELYSRQFAVLPLGLLQLAVQRTIRDHTFNNVPTIGEMWLAVRNVLGKPSDLDAAIDRWSDSVPDGIYRLHEETEMFIQVQQAYEMAKGRNG